MLDILDNIIGGLLNVLVDLLVKILPTSPFMTYMHYFSEFKYLPYINYFLPIDVFVTILESWLLCVASWYVWCFVADIMGWVSSSGVTDMLPKK